MAEPIAYREGYKYQLASPYYFRLPELDHLARNVETAWFRVIPGGVEVLAGYAWDGPSGPALDTPSFMRASLIHDVLYQAMREGYIARTFRPKADRIMRRVARQDGMNIVRRWYTYAAVRAFAKRAANSPGRRIKWAPRKS